MMEIRALLSTVLPLHHPQGGNIQVTSLRSTKMMQAQVVLVHISMVTTITFVIHLMMKGMTPPSNMCTTMTNDIYIELKHDNDNIIMKMLEMCLPTSRNKPYFMPSPNFMNTREDHETTTTKMELRLHQPLWHLRQATSRHLRLRIYDIFANKRLKTTLKKSSPSSSPRLPRDTTTSTSTTRFLYMGLKNPRSISSGSV